MAVRVVDLGRKSYREAYQIQIETVERVIAARERGGSDGEILLVEHDPVITVTKRPGAAQHVLASRELLAAQGVELAQTDRGGDVTYHGPGQIVAYPVLDLNRCGLRLHEYMRLLEQAVIDTIQTWGLEGQRDPDATGVWVETDHGLAKIAAMGVRVRRWVSFHGLAINVDPDLSHFGLIVPCGLAGRPVTSLLERLGDQTPAMAAVRSRLAEALTDSAEQLIDGVSRRSAQRGHQPEQEPRA